MQQQYDVVIVGGGLIGMSLAAALADSPLSILLLEQHQTAPVHANSLDLRTTGLTRSSEHVYARAGIWQDMRRFATPIHHLEVSELNAFGCARINGADHGISPIGYMMPNHQLIKVLSSKLGVVKNTHIQSPARLVSIHMNSHGAELQIDCGGQLCNVVTSLLVGADGAKSSVRELLGIDATHKDYDQTAIVTNALPQKPHDNTAYERFTEDGPLAILPIQENHCAVIWTHATEGVERYLKMNDQVFIQQLQEAFGYRLGKFLQVGKRVAYPLSLTVSEALCKDSALLLGNAAQSVHPVAAQGLNLGLRDVQVLVQLLQECKYKPASYEQLLMDYERLRSPDRSHVIRLTDGLTRVFAARSGPVKSLRSCGIRALGLLPIVQRGMLRRNLGMRFLTSTFS